MSHRRAMMAVLKPGLDSDALAYINIINPWVFPTTAQKKLLSDFVRAEKAAGRWTKHIRIHIHGWADERANRICVKTLQQASYSNTFAGGVIFANGYVESNGTGGFELDQMTDDLGGFEGLNHSLTAMVLRGNQTNALAAVFAGWSGSNGIRIMETADHNIRFFSMTSSEQFGAAGSTGIFVCSRTDTDSGNCHVRNGDIIRNQSNDSAPIAVDYETQPLLLWSDDWGSSNFGTQRIGFTAVGKGFTPVEAEGFSGEIRTLWEGLFGLEMTAWEYESQNYIDLVGSVTAPGTMTGQRQQLLHNFVAAEKTAGRWLQHKRLFIHGWVEEFANSVDLTMQAVGTLSGTVTSANGWWGAPTGFGASFLYDVSPADVGFTYALGTMWVLNYEPRSTGGSIPMGCGAFSGTEFEAFYYTGNGIIEGYLNATACSASFPYGLDAGICCVSRIADNNLTISLRRQEGTTRSLVTSNVNTTPSVTGVAMGVLCYNDAAGGVQTYNSRVGASGLSLLTSHADIDAFTLNLKILWEGLFGLKLPGFDSHAQDYIDVIESIRGVMTSDQKQHVHAFVIREKESGRWAKHKRIYVQGWDGEFPSAIDMKDLGSGTFAGPVSHNNGWWQGDGLTGRFEMDASPAALGLTAAKGTIWCLAYDAGTMNNFFMGSTHDENSWTLISRDSVALGSMMHDIGDSATLFLAGNQRGIAYGVRTSATAMTMRLRNSAGVVGSTMNTGNSTLPASNLAMYVSGVNYLGLTDGMVNGQFGGAGVALFDTVEEADEFTLSYKILWEGLFNMTLP